LLPVAKKIQYFKLVFAAFSSVASPPVFLISPRNTKVTGEGSSVTLDCAANGVPKPFITWLKDGASLDLNHLDSRWRFDPFSTSGEKKVFAQNFC
jgi:hypothetical protein